MSGNKIAYEFFTDEQKRYLDQLIPFAGRTQRLKVVSAQAMPSKKFTYIKENLALLNADEQYNFNKANVELGQKAVQGYLAGFVSGAVMMGMFIARKPLQQKLYMETFQSFLFGVGVSVAYYQWHNYAFREEMHKLYIQVLSRRKLGII